MHNPIIFYIICNMKAHDVLLLIRSSAAARFLGIAKFAKAHNWHLMIEGHISMRPLGWNGNGVLVALRPGSVLEDYVKDLKRRKIPVVDLSNARPDISIPRVSGDNIAMGELAASHFLERNFHHFAWFSSEWGNIQKLRFEGFSSKLDPKPERWVWSEEAPPGRIGDWEALMKNLGEKLKKAPKPLAVFCYSDYDATRVLNVCQSTGIAIPDEVAILGVDNNIMLCENQSIPISSVEHDLEQVGYRGAELLEKLMNGRKAPKNPIFIPPTGIRTRRSTDILATEDDLIKHALRYISEHLDIPLGGAQIAENLKVPRVQLDRRFNAALGRSIGEEILRERIILAKRLLATDQYTVAEIAERSGFCNAAYLSNIFKRETGMTPRKWKLLSIQKRISHDL